MKPIIVHLIYGLIEFSTHWFSFFLIKIISYLKDDDKDIVEKILMYNTNDLLLSNI